MALEKRPAKELVGKLVVTKEGKRIGIVKDLTFETRSGELIQLVITNATSYASSLNLEKGKAGEFLIPYSSIMAIGDFVVVSEEDMR
ncbi:MAG: PRC-barrel domain-containing protein [Candidatus Pacearchaeota archaeon]